MSDDDIVSQAVDENQETDGRKAVGCVEGAGVILRKEQYGPHDRMGTWRITVHVGDNDVPSREVGQLTEAEADEQFETLMNKHNLVEGYEHK